MSASSKAKAGNVDLGTIVKGFEGAYEQAVRDLGRFNLVIFGETGVGKSTLVNAIFGKDVAEAGAGRPVTKSTDYYEHPSGVLGIYDTKGIETGRSEEQILTDLRGIIASKRSLPLEHQIHAIWYSLNANKLRWEASQARFIRELSEENIPILLVLTQVRRKSDGSINPEVTKVIEAIRQDDLPLRPQNRVFPTMAQDDAWDDARAHGLQELLDATFQVAPEGVQNALNAAQRIDLPRKAAQARKLRSGSSSCCGNRWGESHPFLGRRDTHPHPDRDDGQSRCHLRIGLAEGHASDPRRRGLHRRWCHSAGQVRRHFATEVCTSGRNDGWRRDSRGGGQ